MSPNIPLITPIASTINISGLKIDVGNLTAQTSSTWSIQNISIPPIPPNATNTQMHVSEGPGSTPEISSKANPKSKFPCEFLLNPGWNPVVSQELFGQSKQPTINIPSGSQVHVGDEKKVDGGQQKRPLENVTQSCLTEGNPGLTLHQNMAPKGKSLQAQEPMEGCNKLHTSLPLVHKENVIGNNHPYASKLRTAHASSSREKSWIMRMRTCLPITVKQMMNQGGTISWCMRRPPSQIVSSPIPKLPSPRVCLNNLRSDRKGTRLSKLTIWQSMQARRRNKDG
ncbi:hypothetical protein O181_002722 [Austropuccinia psidii MF-1]|uniref:Uncharacterized protein n=1 Tax=Austropuccinia psidii MF-1 TaxID=1389203 RepID=A0A9Q3BDB7_9BASI|nr:hypothetical protein [Austropuccinia psidii MF-1]